MAPNLFLCLRTLCCPTYWFQHGDRVDGDANREQHWETPVPGTYKFLPGRGWHLIQRDDCEFEEKAPAALVYCRILHRYMFESELEERCYALFARNADAPADASFPSTLARLCPTIMFVACKCEHVKQSA